MSPEARAVVPAIGRVPRAAAFGTRPELEDCGQYAGSAVGILVICPPENHLSLEDELLKQRLDRAREIEALGFRPYGRRFDFTHTIPEILDEYGGKQAEELSPETRVRVAGRVQTLRRMGKAGFAHLLQHGERLQIYVKKDAVGEKDFALYQMIDIGDIVGAEGYLFRTRTGELSVHVECL